MQKDYNYGSVPENELNAKQGLSCNSKRENMKCAKDLEDILNSIIVRPTALSIAIEFECGDCCKKVLNGETITVTDCFVILRPAVGELLELKVFSGGTLVERQQMALIIIPIDKVCSIEFGAVEVS